MLRRFFSAMALLVLALVVGLAAGVLLAAPAHETGRLLVLLAAAGALGLLAALALSLSLARQITRPLGDLTEAVEKTGVSGGGERVFPVSHDEVSRLGETFNRMSERLADRIARLEEERQQLHTILSGMVEGVVALDADQRILFVNDRAAQLLEFPAASTVGRHLWEVVRQRPLLDAVRHALDTPEAHREEFTFHGAATRILTVHAAPLLPAPGTGGADVPRGAVLVLHDTSALRRLEQLRQEFVANVSHELKTPLSVIQVCVETLIDGAIDDPAHRGRFLDQIARQSDRLHALILDLLSLARIESEGAPSSRDFAIVELEPLVRACLERHRPRAEARQQVLLLGPTPLGVSNQESAISHQVLTGGSASLTPDPCPLTPVKIWGDEEAVQQVLENLLDNALKYTPAGGRVRVGWHARDGHACIEVEDTGIGIPEADLPRIFERFYRVDKARSRELGGTGLGLSIVKHLVQAMHGTVRASSRVGQGTTFTVCLPLARA
jgi:two-component system phosphate regulon sensor histidine kinase PhoR